MATDFGIRHLQHTTLMMTICLSSWGYNTEDDTSVKHQEVQDNRIEITLIDSSRDAKFQKTGSNLESIPKDELESLSGFKADKTDSDDHQCFENVVIQASSFRTYHTPLNKQVDFVNSIRAA
nr:Niemann-Pick C1 protein-like [Tanacetum cinerariifolium]